MGVLQSSFAIFLADAFLAFSSHQLTGSVMMGDPVTSKLRTSLVQASRTLNDVVVVSHRWLSPDNPDVTGEQLTAIRSFLHTSEWVKFIWFDFCSLPQGERNPAEEVYFDAALKLVNLLHLDAHVLILLDAAYQRRFWCLCETFLASHKFNGALVPEGDRKRVDAICVGSFGKCPPAVQDVLSETLFAVWGNTSVEDFIKQMWEDDIEVTNKGDKKEQSDKLANLSATLQHLHQAIDTEGPEAEIRHSSVPWCGHVVYVGELKEHKMHGQGMRTWADGAVYNGQWKEDMKHGKGMYTWANGTAYEGEWKENNMVGKGCTQQ